MVINVCNGNCDFVYHLPDGCVPNGENGYFSLSSSNFHFPKKSKQERKRTK